MSELLLTNKSDLVAIADAVRSKTGTTEQMSLDGIVSGINNIETGSGSIDTVTITLTNEEGMFYYTDENLELIESYDVFFENNAGSIKVAKNTLFYFICGSGATVTSTFRYEMFTDSSLEDQYYIFFITEDGSISHSAW